MTDTTPIRVRVDGEPLVWTVIRLQRGRAQLEVELATAGRRLVVPVSHVRQVDEPPHPEAPT